MSGFFNQNMPTWAGGGGSRGQQGRDGGDSPDRRDRDRSVRFSSFDNDGDYDFPPKEGGISYGIGHLYERRRDTISDGEYEARRQAIFQPDGAKAQYESQRGGQQDPNQTGPTNFAAARRQ
jgi:hypothetical protein